MVENNDNSQVRLANANVATNQGDEDRQTLLLQLAERTVLQAEALAKEITDRARQESEAEGAKLLEQYAEQAKQEAQRIVGDAQQQGETLIKEATVKAQADGKEILKKADAERDDLLEKASAEMQEILRRAQQEAAGILNAARVRSDSTQAKARLNAEFIIRETTQNVSDGIRSAILETCNSLLPDLEKYGMSPPEEAPQEGIELGAESKPEIIDPVPAQSEDVIAASEEITSTDSDPTESNNSPRRRSRSANSPETS